MPWEMHPMDHGTALAAAAWKYPPPYAIYNMSADKETLAEMTGGRFYAVFRDQEMVGYFCFGRSARVPWAAKEGYYSQEYIDIGLAMRPDLTGRGSGLEFFTCGLEYAGVLFPGMPIRLTVAAFNQRARKVYQRAGFIETDEFSVPGGQDFLIMVLDKKSATNPAEL